MSDLDARLAAWNPVPAEDMPHACASADAARLLRRILDQQPQDQPAMGSPTKDRQRRRARRPRWKARAWIATVAAAVTIAGMAVTLPSSGHQPGPPTGPPVPADAFQYGPSQGVASNAVELVDYATRSAALAAVFVPDPLDWEYLKSYHGPGRVGGYSSGNTEELWQQVGTTRCATPAKDGGIDNCTGGGPGAQLAGWPGSANWTTMYQYLASLPASPDALRKVILANNHGSPAAAFIAVQNITDFPLPPRFQAELYAVLAGLPGVRFNQHAVDAAGRRGVGLYRVAGNAIGEIIVNPRTYGYMGWLSFVIRPGRSYQAQLAHPDPAAIDENGALLSSGIVSQAGQRP